MCHLEMSPHDHIRCYRVTALSPWFLLISWAPPFCSFSYWFRLYLSCSTTLLPTAPTFGAKQWKHRDRKEAASLPHSLEPHLLPLGWRAVLLSFTYSPPPPHPQTAVPGKEPLSHSSHPCSLSPSVSTSGFLGALIPSWKIQKEKQNFKLTDSSVWHSSSSHLLLFTLSSSQIAVSGICSQFTGAFNGKDQVKCAYFFSRTRTLNITSEIYFILSEY